MFMAWKVKVNFQLCTKSSSVTNQFRQGRRAISSLSLIEVKESFAEACNPKQNPVESNAIKWLKCAGERLFYHTGVPDSVWIWACQYLALVNNWAADRTLGWKCPSAKRHGVTPDISALLSFHLYEPVYHLDVEEPAPVVHNVGDALTSHILILKRKSNGVW
jgi:hypothetical protein